MGKVSRKRASEILGLSQLTVLRMIQDGRLKAEKNDSGYWEVEESELEQFVESWSSKTEQASLHFEGKQRVVKAVEKKIESQKLRLKALLNNASIALRDNSKHADSQLQEVKEAIQQYEVLKSTIAIIESTELQSDYEVTELVHIEHHTEGDEN